MTTDQIEIHLPSGRIAVADVELELVDNHSTDHWLSGGEVHSRDFVDRRWAVSEVHGMRVVLADNREREVKEGSRLWVALIRQLGAKFDLLF